MDRRRWLQGIALASAAPGRREGAAAASAPDPDSDSGPMITDTNVSLFQWPFRRLPCDEAPALAEKLRSLGIARAWAGSFEGIFHRDLGEANRRLAAACGEEGMFLPFGSVNPALPGWEEDLRQCREEHGMPGIRLHPGYHGYTLEDPRFRELLALAANAGLRVQLAASLEDPRTQHPRGTAADVDLAPLPAVMDAVPGARVQILNGRFRPGAAETLAAHPGIAFDMARAEGTDGVARLLLSVGRDRVCFGTHAPFFIPESALIKVHESDLAPEELDTLLEGNALSFLS